MQINRLFLLSTIFTINLFSTELTLIVDQINVDNIVNNMITESNLDKKITDFWDSSWLHHLCYSIQNQLIAQGCSLTVVNSASNTGDFINIVNRSTYIIDLRGSSYGQFNFWSRFPLNVSKKLILVIWEPRIVCPDIYDQRFHNKCYKILTWNDLIVDNKKYFLFRYPVYTNFKICMNNIIHFADKQFICMVSMNKKSHLLQEPSEFFQDLYKERLEFINFCENQQLVFDLYGKYWDKKHHNSYRGEISQYGKLDILKHYKFSICYENSREVGYVTEKIFDCFRAACVPVYYGAYNIDELIPKNCFVDRRDFADNEALYSYLVNMTELEYYQYILAIQRYLLSGAEQFSSRYFIKSVANVLK